MPKAKKSFKVTSEWSNIIRQGEHLVREESGEIYRFQPVDLETFVSSPDYLGQNLWGLSEPQKEFIDNVSDFENGKNFFVLYIGKGGGKNFSSGVAFLYVVYKLLCMYDPHKYLNHNKSKNITLINVAINAIQAKKNFFDPMVNMLKQAGAKAFRDFGFDPEKDVLSASIQFPGNIEIMSANSRAGGIEGYDILLALADEVDDVEFHSVDKILNTLRTSAQSRFIGKEKVIVISYRRYVGSSGKILEYFNSARGLNHVYARRYASWEFHPARPREFFQQYYDENPEKAACMYGSDMSGSYVDSWIKDPKRIKKAMNLNRKWIFDWPLPYQTIEVNSEEWWARDIHDEWKQSPMSEHTYADKNGIQKILDPYDIPIKEYGNPNYYYVMCGDPALGSDLNGGDGYGITLAHREVIKDEMGRKFVRPVIDFAFRFTGRMFPEGQVQMKAIEDLIVKLKSKYGYNIKLFSWDGWNSASLTQWLAKTYRDAIIYDRSIVETKDYTALRDAIFGEAPPTSGQGGKESNGGIDIPWHPILYDELMNLREDRCFTGDTKVKLLNGSVKTFSDLTEEYEKNKKPFWIYAFDKKENKFVPALADFPRVTYYTRNIVKVTLDDDTEIKCTPDHKFMLSDGSWKEAGNLQIKDSLKHLSIRFKPIGKTNEYEHVRINDTWIPTHRWVFDEIYGKEKRTGNVIHHVNFDRYDNTPENLQTLTWDAHKSLHAEHINEVINFNFKNSQKRYEAWSKKEKTMVEKRREIIKKAQKAWFKVFGRADVSLEKIIDMKEKNLSVNDMAQILNCNPALIYARVKQAGFNVRTFFGNSTLPKVELEKIKEIWVFNMKRGDVEKALCVSRWQLEKSFDGKLWSEISSELDKLLLFKTYEKGMSLRQLAKKLNSPFSTFHHRLNALGLTKEMLELFNHKVKKIEFIELEKAVPMYDLTVENYGNFLLADGNIIVSNSKNPPKIDHTNQSTKDISDTVARAVRLVVYEWPFMDVIATGNAYSFSEDTRKVQAGIASPEEKAKHEEGLLSNSIGLGKWKQTQRGGRALRLEDVLPDINSTKL